MKRFTSCISRSASRSSSFRSPALPLKPMFKVADGIPLKTVSPTSMNTRFRSSSTAASSDGSFHFP